MVYHKSKGFMDITDVVCLKCSICKRRVWGMCVEHKLAVLQQLKGQCAHEGTAKLRVHTLQGDESMHP